MKYITGIIVLVLAAAGAWCLSQDDNEQGTNPEVLSVQTTALDKVRSGEAILIDVRTPEEYAAGHAKGAMLFDSRRVEQGEVPDVPKDKEVFLYCRSGHRASLVKPILERKGFTRVTSLGGLPDMEALGAEMVK